MIDPPKLRAVKSTLPVRKAQALVPIKNTVAPLAKQYAARAQRRSMKAY